MSKKYYEELKDIQKSSRKNEEKAMVLRKLYEKVLCEHLNYKNKKNISLDRLIGIYKKKTTKKVSIKKFYNLKRNLNHWNHFHTDILTDEKLNGYFITMQYVIDTVTDKKAVEPSKGFPAIRLILFWGLLLWINQMYDACLTVQCLFIPSIYTGLIALILVFAIQNIFSDEKKEERRLRKLEENKKRKIKEMEAQKEKEKRERIKQEEKREKEREAERKRQKERDEAKAALKKLLILAIVAGVLYYIYRVGG